MIIKNAQWITLMSQKLTIYLQCKTTAIRFLPFHLPLLLWQHIWTDASSDYNNKGCNDIKRNQCQESYFSIAIFVMCMF